MYQDLLSYRVCMMDVNENISVEKKRKKKKPIDFKINTQNCINSRDFGTYKSVYRLGLNKRIYMFTTFFHSEKRT